MSTCCRPSSPAGRTTTTTPCGVPEVSRVSYLRISKIQPQEDEALFLYWYLPGPASWETPPDLGMCEFDGARRPSSVAVDRHPIWHESGTSPPPRPPVWSPGQQTGPIRTIMKSPDESHGRGQLPAVAVTRPRHVPAPVPWPPDHEARREPLQLRQRPTQGGIAGTGDRGRPTSGGLLQPHRNRPRPSARAAQQAGPPAPTGLDRHRGARDHRRAHLLSRPPRRPRQQPVEPPPHRTRPVAAAAAFTPVETSRLVTMNE